MKWATSFPGRFLFLLNLERRLPQIIKRKKSWERGCAVARCELDLHSVAGAYKTCSITWPPYNLQTPPMHLVFCIVCINISSPRNGESRRHTDCSLKVVGSTALTVSGWQMTTADLVGPNHTRYAVLYRSVQFKWNCRPRPSKVACNQQKELVICLLVTQSVNWIFFTVHCNAALKF